MRGTEVARLESTEARSAAATARADSHPRLGRRQPAVSAMLESWLPAAVIVAGLALWELAVRAGWISALFFPAPSLIATTLLRMLGTAAFWLSLGATLFRLVAGLLIGGGAGLLLDLVMGASRPLRAALDPVVAALHALPKLAIFPIFLVLFGIGEASKVALVALPAFFPGGDQHASWRAADWPNLLGAAANYGASTARWASATAAVRSSCSWRRMVRGRLCGRRIFYVLAGAEERVLSFGCAFHTRRAAFLRSGEIDETGEMHDFAQWCVRAQQANLCSVMLSGLLSERRVHETNH